MLWKKCLYLQQDYPINYIETHPVEKKRDFYAVYEDINRIVIRVSIVIVNFCLFRIMVFEDGIGMTKASWFSFITTFTEIFLQNGKYVGINLKPSFLLLVFAYLLSPLIQALTLEISSDTIYVYFIITQFFFVIDSVSAEIYNKVTPVEIKDAMIPLSLEESINIPKKIFSNQILGLTSYFLGFILLSSRLRSSISVFNLLCLTFMGYIILPKHFERHQVHKRTKSMLLLYIFVSVLSLCSEIMIFCIYNCLITYLYSISYISIWLLEKDLKENKVEK